MATIWLLASWIPEPLAIGVLTTAAIVIFIIRSNRRAREDMIHRLYGPGGRPGNHDGPED